MTFLDKSIYGRYIHSEDVGERSDRSFLIFFKSSKMRFWYSTFGEKKVPTVGGRYPPSHTLPHRSVASLPRMGHRSSPQSWKQIDTYEATAPTALWTLHRACAPRTGVSVPDFLPFPRIVRGPVRGICEFDTLFSYFPVLDTLNAMRALRAGWRKRYPFYAFLLTRWCTGPNETCPPPPRGLYKVNGDSVLLVLKGTSLKSDNAFLVLSRRLSLRFTDIHIFSKIIIEQFKGIV